MNELKNGHVKTVADTVIGNPIQFRLASRLTYIYKRQKGNAVGKDKSYFIPLF
jgi:hypothetical protein